MLEQCTGQTAMENGIQTSTSDAGIYIAQKGQLFFIAVYVDDIILAGKTDDCMKEVKA